MATLLQHRTRLLTRGIPALVILVLPLLGTVASSPATFLDAFLTAVDGTAITASDIALARALGLLGFHPSDDPITMTDVERAVDARLVEGEAARMGIRPTSEEAEEAWRAAADRVGDMLALTGWLASTGLEEAWAKRMIEADLRWRRFIDLRFRAFVFVSETDVAQALGSGPHPAELRERTRRALEAETVNRELAEWLADARRRASIRYAWRGERAIPLPFPMPPASGHAAEKPG